MQAKCYFAQTDLDYRRNADGNPIVAIAPHSKQIQTAISIQEHFIATQESITKEQVEAIAIQEGYQKEKLKTYLRIC
ncbi:MAG: hypothetical protein HC770_09600 [Pseudanabaena sp. CRU_2_10]|nr:hypothetical protein [Pseudanabaena sp. CRU_2_10]